MNSRLATALSVTGVLLAGSVAALVNTHVLDSTSAAQNTVSVEAPASAPPAAAAPATPPSTAAVASTAMNVTVIGHTPATATTGGVAATAAVGQPVTPTEPATSTTLDAVQQDVQVGDAAVVTIDQRGDALTLVAATPKPGWTVVSTATPTADEVDVVLRSTTQEVTFQATSVAGALQPSVQVRSLTTVTAPAGTSGHGEHGDDHGDNGGADD